MKNIRINSRIVNFLGVVQGSREGKTSLAGDVKSG